MKPSPRVSKIRQSFAVLIISLFLGICGALLLKERVWVIQGTSMLPTFQDGKRIVIVYNSDAPARGDIVLVNVTDPDKQVSRVLIKRVIGIPGDRIQFSLGTKAVLLNGVPLVEPYVNGIPFYDAARDLTLGPDQYFIMGDNRNDSLDSRAMGPVKLRQIRHIPKSYFTF